MKMKTKRRRWKQKKQNFKKEGEEKKEGTEEEEEEEETVKTEEKPNIYLFIYFVKAYSLVNHTGSPQGFSLKQILQKSNTMQHIEAEEQEEP